MKTEWSAPTALFDMNMNEMITLPFFVLMLGMLDLTKRMYDGEHFLIFGMKLNGTGNELSFDF